MDQVDPTTQSAEPEHQTDNRHQDGLWKQITKYFLDKILPPLLIALFAAALAYYFSSLQQQVNFKHEIDKIRIQKVGETWEKYKEFEVSFYALKQAIDDLRLSARLSDKELDDQTIYEDASIKPLTDDLSKKGDELWYCIEKNRFYLGGEIVFYFEELFRRVHLIRVTQEAQVFYDSQGNYDAVNISEAEGHLQEATKLILHFRDMFLRGEI